MRTAIAAAAVVSVVALIAGCEGTSNDRADEPKPASQATDPCGRARWAIKADLIPCPSESQQRRLVTRLDAIAPGLASEPAETVENARNECESILRGATKLAEAARIRFVGDGIKTMTADQARQIVSAIRAEAWCTK